MPHPIQLHGPWTLAVSNDADSSQSVRLPGEIRLPELVPAQTVITLTRNFHEPTGLTDESPVMLKGEVEFAGEITVSLNETQLGNGLHNQFAFAIARLLQPTNQLVLACRTSTDCESILVNRIWLELD